MKFISIENGSPDGRLHLCSSDGLRIVAAEAVKTLQEAMENWQQHSALWKAQYQQLQNNPDAGTKFDSSSALSPLPRAWQWLDGSAFETHSLLIQQAWGLPVNGLPDIPLMYQGLSDCFLPPTSDAVFPSTDDGIDYEGEFGVILDYVPMGSKAAEAAQFIRLVVLINDWSLRAIGPREMATGFGWLQCKPPCSIAPMAVTPDELGDAWQHHRVCLPLEIKRNGKVMGRANGREMKFGFDELIEHAAYSRSLPAGTILGSGTVSNKAYAEIGSSCLAETRAVEQINNAAASTEFLKHGDRVEMSVNGLNGDSVFGPINQLVKIYVADRYPAIPC